MRTRYTTNNGTAALSEPSFAADWNSPEDRIYDRPRPVLSETERLLVLGVISGMLAWWWTRWLRAGWW